MSGCGSSASRVETLKSWSFQYNEGTSDYSLFFGLADKNDKSLSADVDVDIRIVNDADEEVYAGIKSVSPDDFSNYTSQAAGEQYLANVRIPAAEIKAGTSASGKVYFTVYKENAVQFDEVNCDALYCLPIEDVQVTFDSFPLDLKVKDFMGSTTSEIQIKKTEYTYNKNKSPKLTKTIKGNKKVNLKEFQKTAGTRPLSFASESDLMNILNLSSGAVTPLGLLNDEQTRTIMYLDRDFIKEPSLIGVHPNDNTATVWLKTHDLIRIIKEHGNIINLIEI